jgi:hypothetical protein
MDGVRREGLVSCEGLRREQKNKKKLKNLKNVNKR